MNDSNNGDVHLVELQDRKSNSFRCPCCGSWLTFRIHVGVKGVSPIPESEIPTGHRSKFIKAHEAMIAAGIWEAFKDAFNRLQDSSVPRDVQNFAQTWLSTAKVAKLPSNAMWNLIKEWGESGKIEVWASNYIAAILVNGMVRAFVPYSLLKGESFHRLTVTGQQITKTNENIDLPIWIRSRWGYVVGKGAFLEAIRKRCIGEFDR